MRRVVLGSLLLAVLRPSAAAACECVHPLDAAARYSAPVVFQGRVIRTALRWGPALWLGLDDAFFADQVEVEFEVSRVWRGDVSSSTVVTTGLGGGDCGVEFRVGTEYLVPAHVTDDGLSTTVCSGVEDLWIIGPLSTADPGGWYSPMRIGTPTWPRDFLRAYTIVAALVIILLGVSLASPVRHVTPDGHDRRFHLTQGWT